MFEFLGRVNRWPLRDDEGTDRFARPHDIAVGMAPATNALPARLVHGTAIGPVARLEFTLESTGDRTVNVEVTRERWRELALNPGDVAYLAPSRLHRFTAGQRT